MMKYCMQFKPRLRWKEFELGPLPCQATLSSFSYQGAIPYKTALNPADLARLGYNDFPSFYKRLLCDFLTPIELIKVLMLNWC